MNGRTETPVNFKYSVNELIEPNGIVKKEFISDTGPGNVKELAEYLTQDAGRDSKGVSVNQVRKFYDTFLKIYYNKSSDQEKKIQLIMLKAQVEYSVKRLKILNFGAFFENRINIVVSEKNDFLKNLDGFKLHFEALIGYFPK